MTKIKWQHALLLTVFLFISVTAMCKKPVFKKTVWEAVEKIFVADAGTMTITYTLEFTSAKNVQIKEESNLPPYHAMYMNPDGTVPMMPGQHSERTETGTYRVKGNMLTITTDDGHESLYFITREGKLTHMGYNGTELEFSQVRTL